MCVYVGGRKVGGEEDLDMYMHVCRKEERRETISMNE
jgi:hypothetical protein